MKEIQHDPEKRERLKPKKAERGFHPIRALRNLIIFLILVAAFLYGGLLLIVQTDGFRELVCDAIEENTGIPVEIDSISMATWGEITVSGIVAKGSHPMAEMSAETVTVIPDWYAVIGTHEPRAQSVTAEKLKISVVELSDGTRAPLYLTEPLDLTRWKVFVDPEDMVDGEMIADVGTAVAKELPEFPEEEEPGWWQKSGMFRIHIREGQLRVQQENGTEKVLFDNLSYDFDPGDGKGEGALQDPRHSISGTYRFGTGATNPRKLKLEVLDQDGRWVFLNTEADQDLFFWLQELQSGPIVSVREVDFAKVEPLAVATPVPAPTAPPVPTPPKLLTVQIGTQVIYQTEREVTDEFDEVALRHLIEQIIDEHRVALPAPVE